MNILILSWRGPGHPQAGGAEQATWRHITAWAAAGHQITLFTSSFASAPSREVISGVDIIRHLDQYIGVKIAAFFWYIFGRHSRFDLVVDEFHGIPFFTPLYVRVKKLAYIHETGTRVWALNFWPFPLNLLPAIFGPLLEPIIFKLFYPQVPFMTVSSSTASDLRKFGITHTTIIPNGVTLINPLPKISKSPKFTIICLSTLAKDKGSEDAIKVFELVKQELPDSQLWMVGSGASNYLDYLKSLSTYPQYFGFVSESEKFYLLSKAHVLLFPSVHEGWGLVVIEANTMGVPTVAYNVSGCRDSIQDKVTGFLCPLGELDCLAQKILQLANNAGLYRKVSYQAKLWSKKYSWPTATCLSLRLIESL